MKKYIIALDAGTTSNRAIVFDEKLDMYGTAQSEFTQYYPQSGWVEQDPVEIWATQNGVMNEVIAKAGIKPESIEAIGITNQRETTILWDRETGRPVYNAIVWQCRRTADFCKELEEEGWTEYIRETTGLIPDAYFSGTKIKWILDRVEGARERAAKGEILFGTVDSWLIWNLTEGKVHVTDVTNASRTMLYDIVKGCWDEKLLERLDIPSAMLPEVRNSSEIYGYANIQGVSVPIAAACGDQQAALFGQTCFEKGEAKNTYGTGAFLLMNTGEEMIPSKNGLLTTIASGIDDCITYALEGSVFVAGAVIQWLRDELKIVEESPDTEFFAGKVSNNGGVYFVPAFTGLGAPYWDPYARGSILGLSRGANKNHIIRAALESIAFQTHDILRAMERDAGIPLAHLQVDGGASRNNFLLQFQADLLETTVRRPVNYETTALGACMLAGLATGFYESREALKRNLSLDWGFTPKMPAEEREELLKYWHRAVERSRAWTE